MNNAHEKGKRIGHVLGVACIGTAAAFVVWMLFLLAVVATRAVF